MTVSVKIPEQNPLKKIITETFQDRFYNGLLYGSILSVLQELMAFVQEIIDDLERDGRSPKTACRRCCDYCCYSHLRIIPVEALLIISFIEIYFNTRKLSCLKQRINRNLRLTNNKTIEERFFLKEKTPCVFLEKGVCTIYPVRPFICRAWNSLDKASCKSAFNADTYHAEIETSSVRNSVFGLARTIFVELSQQVNLQSSKLEMSQAVFKCLNMHNPTALWLTGYPIFDSELKFKPVDESLAEFRPNAGREDTFRESEYVDYFYKKYQGRVASGAGYDRDVSSIYPFIFQNAYGSPIGIVTIGVVSGEKDTVHLYHIGSFITRKGDGSLILAELCRKADCFNIRLSVSPAYMPDSKAPRMNYDRLSKWYGRFDFKGESNLIRMPRLQPADI